MADKHELEISISETGDVTVQVHGAKGKKCLELTQEIEESLGIVKSRETKSSFYEQDNSEKISITGENR